MPVSQGWELLFGFRVTSVNCLKHQKALHRLKSTKVSSPHPHPILLEEQKPALTLLADSFYVFLNLLGTIC